MKKHFSTIILVLVFITGLSLLLYPSLSDYWNSFHQSRAIAGYAEAVSRIDDVDYEKIWNAAVTYNEKLLSGGNRWFLNEKEQEEYDSLLNISGNGVMGYVEIPKINVSLPIYHGTDEGVLQVAVGHIAGSSLPVGGSGTHCVISGHRGLPSAKLFTNLDQMEKGDTFMLRVLDETLTYEVDQILIVEPDDISALDIEEGKDYCTLVTCTPYGVNTHRLLVRGHRIENQKDASSVRVTADAMQIDPVIVAPVAAAPMLLILLIVLLITTRKRGRK
ncbi:MAG: class C sortase [Lachnospiraceae bacterium]|nr:class C sortase [Lachnospiraceae bacterium]